MFCLKLLLQNMHKSMCWIFSILYSYNCWKKYNSCTKDWQDIMFHILNLEGINIRTWLSGRMAVSLRLLEDHWKWNQAYISPGYTFCLSWVKSLTQPAEKNKFCHIFKWGNNCVSHFHSYFKNEFHKSKTYIIKAR